MDRIPGMLALVGGGEWSEGCSFDAGFLAASGSDDVLVLPTAAAYEHPERLVIQAGTWFEPLGGQVEGLMVVSRADAEDRAGHGSGGVDVSGEGEGAHADAHIRADDRAHHDGPASTRPCHDHHDDRGRVAADDHDDVTARHHHDVVHPHSVRLNV